MNDNGGDSGLPATLPVTFRLPGVPDLTIDLLIAPDFSGFIALPPAAVAAMRLPFLHIRPIVLADGSVVEASLFCAMIVWQGTEHEAPVLAVGSRPRIGTGLLTIV